MAKRKRRNDGKAFEAAFGEYLEAQGFIVNPNEPCRGATADRPYDCDLHGVKHSAMFRNVGVGAFALAVATMFFPDSLDGVRRTAEATVTSFSPGRSWVRGVWG